MWLVVQSKSKPKTYPYFSYLDEQMVCLSIVLSFKRKKKQMSYAIVTQLQAKSNIVWTYSTSEYKSDYLRYVIGGDAWEILNLKFNLHIKSTFDFWLVNKFVKSKIVKSFRATTCQIFLFTFSKKLNQKCSVTLASWPSSARVTFLSKGHFSFQIVKLQQYWWL